MEKIIEVNLDDLKDGMAKAYENFAIRAGYKVNDKTMFDCREIEVSKEIDDYFWKYYKEKGQENSKLTEEEIKTSIAMLMLQNGAKRNEALEPWTIKVNEKFVINERE